MQNLYFPNAMTESNDVELNDMEVMPGRRDVLGVVTSLTSCFRQHTQIGRMRYNLYKYRNADTYAILLNLDLTVGQSIFAD